MNLEQADALDALIWCLTDLLKVPSSQFANPESYEADGVWRHDLDETSRLAKELRKSVKPNSQLWQKALTASRLSREFIRLMKRNSDLASSDPQNWKLAAHRQLFDDLSALVRELRLEAAAMMSAIIETSIVGERVSTPPVVPALGEPETPDTATKINATSCVNSAVSTCDALLALLEELKASSGSRINTEGRGRFLYSMPGSSQFGEPDANGTRRLLSNSDPAKDVKYYSDWNWAEHGEPIVAKYREQLEEFANEQLDSALFARAFTELERRGKLPTQMPLVISTLGAADANRALSYHQLLQLLVRQALKCFDSEDPEKTLEALRANRSLRIQWRGERVPKSETNTWCGVADLKEFLDLEAITADAVLGKQAHNAEATGSPQANTTQDKKVEEVEARQREQEVELQAKSDRIAAEKAETDRLAAIERQRLADERTELDRQRAKLERAQWSKWLSQDAWRKELLKTFKQLSVRTFHKMRTGKHSSISIRCHPNSSNSNLSMNLEDLRMLGYDGD